MTLQVLECTLNNLTPGYTFIYGVGKNDIQRKLNNFFCLLCFNIAIYTDFSPACAVSVSKRIFLFGIVRFPHTVLSMRSYSLVDTVLFVNCIINSRERCTVLKNIS